MNHQSFKLLFNNDKARVQLINLLMAGHVAAIGGYATDVNLEGISVEVGEAAAVETTEPVQDEPVAEETNIEQ